MNNPAHPAQQFDVDFAPALRMYLDNVESWRKNCEKLFANASATTAKSGAELISPNYDQTMAGLQQAGGDAFKRFVEQQIELCRFFAKRWELYRELPEKMARCKTPVELAQIQFDFLNRMGAEYLQESAKLAQPLTEMMTTWASAHPIH